MTISEKQAIGKGGGGGGGGGGEGDGTGRDTSTIVPSFGGTLVQCTFTAVGVLLTVAQVSLGVWGDLAVTCR